MIHHQASVWTPLLLASITHWKEIFLLIILEAKTHALAHEGIPLHSLHVGQDQIQQQQLKLEKRLFANLGKLVSANLIPILNDAQSSNCPYLLHELADIWGLTLCPADSFQPLTFAGPSAAGFHTTCRIRLSALHLETEENNHFISC